MCAVFCKHAHHVPRHWQLPDGTIATQATNVCAALTESRRVTFMVKHCSISLATSFSCELEGTTIKSSTCTEVNTLRAWSTKSVGCASDRVKPGRNVSTSAKRSWKSRDTSLNPFNPFRRVLQVDPRTLASPQAWASASDQEWCHRTTR